MKLNEIANSQQFYTDKNLIDEWIYSHCDISSYDDVEILPDGTVNISGSISFMNKFKTFKVNFSEVHGDVIMCFEDMLESFDGCPKIIHGNFDACGCLSRDTNDIGALPVKVSGLYDISFNDVVIEFNICPKVVDTLNISNTGITSLIGIADHFESIFQIAVEPGQIISGGIGILLIDKFDGFYKSSGEPFDAWITIINKYVGRPDDIFECQAELIAAGYGKYAQL